MRKPPSTNHIAQYRARRGMSQQQLADALDVHWTTVSKLERGITRLDFDYAEKIADILKCDIYDLVQLKPIITISISGLIHHGGDVEPIDEKDEAHNKPIIISSAMFYALDTFWVAVVDNALYPYFRDGDLLGVSWVADEERRNDNGDIDYSPFYGRFCLVENADEDQFMGVLSPGSRPDLVTLNNANFPPLANIEPSALGQVTVSIMATPNMLRTGRQR